MNGTSDGQRGASAVEFAIIVPLFLMLTFGMISGAMAYDRKNTMTHASREGSRYGATLSVQGTTSVPDAWLTDVAQTARVNANGHLDTTIPGQYLCVAYVGYEPRQGSVSDWTRKRVESGGVVTFSSGSATSPASWCYDDGRGSNADLRRVQVVTGRTAQFNAVLWSSDLQLRSEAVARFEAVRAR